jgi:hypothetical protein
MTLSNTSLQNPQKSMPLVAETVVETMRQAIESDGEILVYVEGTDISWRPTQEQAQKFCRRSQVDPALLVE